MSYGENTAETEIGLGQENWAAAAETASTCGSFIPDVEEEWIADEPISCYNCRYRRWTARSFDCRSPQSPLTSVTGG